MVPNVATLGGRARGLAGLTCLVVASVVWSSALLVLQVGGPRPRLEPTPLQGSCLEEPILLFHVVGSRHRHGGFTVLRGVSAGLEIREGRLCIIRPIPLDERQQMRHVHCYALGWGELMGL